MKILLVTPYQLNTPTRWIPIGLAYIASSLINNNHNVTVYDRHIRAQQLVKRELLDDDFKAEILRYNPDIIGFSTVSPVIYDTVESVAFVRTFYKGIIIAGGHHATALPEETLRNLPGVDYIAAGEGEISLLSLANGENPETIPGIFTRNTIPSQFTNAKIAKLDDLPIPKYDIFDMHYYTKANYSTIRGYYLKTAEILTSRGCTNNCSFCSETLTYGNGVRYHSPDYVIENIEKLISTYDINAIYLHDNDFLNSRKHAEDICKKIISKGINKKIKWAVQAGTNKVDNDILKLMSSAGCIAIEFGMESIKEESLRQMNKKRSANLNEKVMKLCNRNNISVHSYFITGMENETLNDLNSLIKWISKYSPHSFNLSPLQIHPGTQLYQHKGNKFFESNEWTKSNVDSYYKSNSQNNINKDELEKWYTETYYPFYKKHHKKWLLKNNSLSSIIKLAIEKYTD